MKVKKVLVFICMIFTLCLGFYGCGEVFKTGPDYNAAVIGNGGLAVMKGEYIYFVNGYNAAEDNYQQNKGDKIYYSAIYRVKAEDSNFNITTAEDGKKSLMFNEGTLPECDEKGNLPGAERLVSKVAGFENTKLFIFGDTLYFTTHTNSRSVSSGETNTSGVEVYRVNLNGKDLKRVHTMSTFDADKGQVNFYQKGKDVYCVFFDGKNKLAIYKNNKLFLEKSKVTELAMPYFNYHTSEIDLSEYQTIFYVEDEKLYSLEIGSKDSEEWATTASVTLVGVSNKRLFYVQNSYLRYIDFGFTNFEENSDDRVISRQSATDYLVMNTDEIKIVVKNSDGIHIFNYIENDVPPFKTLTTNTSANLLFVQGENVFYNITGDTDGGIYMASETMDAVKISSDKKCVFNGNSVASITNKFVYFYTEFENKNGKSVYLSRIDLTSSAYDSNDVCVRLEKDYIDEEEEDTNNEEQ